MKLEGLSQAALEHASGVDRTTVSRFLAGERIPSRDQLAQILVGISGDRERRLELLFAHLRDEAAPSARAGITEAHFILRAVDSGGPAPENSLAAELELLGDESALDENLRSVLVEMARLVRAHRAREADAAAGAVYPFRPEAEPIVAEAPAASPRRRRATPPVPKPPAAG